MPHTRGARARKSSARATLGRVTLLDELRSLLGRNDTLSFQLMGEDLVVLSGARLRRAAEAYDAELERAVPPSLRAPLAREQAEVLGEAHEWLLSYNKSIHTRIQGYLALGRRCRFEYPWPVVAILGICQVLRSIQRVHLYGLVGAAAARAGYTRLLELAERSDDALRRTNRGIFADSAPTVLYALHCHALRAEGRADLASLLLTGPLPLSMDAETQRIAQALYDYLAIADDAQRFRALSELTLRHFAREQTIFSHHLGALRGERPRADRGGLLHRLFEVDSVPAPRVERGRVVFRRFALPPGFVMRDHDARVAAFSDAFVRSITQSLSDYRVAVDYVLGRFGDPDEVADLGYLSA
jgi:hypothetical protein